MFNRIDHRSDEHRKGLDVQSGPAWQAFSLTLTSKFHPAQLRPIASSQRGRIQTGGCVICIDLCVHCAGARESFPEEEDERSLFGGGGVRRGVVSE